MVTNFWKVNFVGWYILPDQTVVKIHFKILGYFNFNKISFKIVKLKKVPNHIMFTCLCTDAGCSIKHGIF